MDFYQIYITGGKYDTVHAVSHDNTDNTDLCVRSVKGNGTESRSEGKKRTLIGVNKDFITQLSSIQRSQNRDDFKEGRREGWNGAQILALSKD